MNIRSVLIALALMLLAVFALLNWAAFTAPTTLSVGFAEVQAPLGLIMLIVTGVVSALFLLYIVFMLAGALMETRRSTKELNAQRDLADKAEASRFSELRSFLEGELRKMEAQAAAGTREIGARVDALQKQLQDKLDESTRSLSAYVGEVDDKLDPHGQDVTALRLRCGPVAARFRRCFASGQRQRQAQARAATRRGQRPQAAAVQHGHALRDRQAQAADAAAACA